jgi:hypothetical protein
MPARWDDEPQVRTCSCEEHDRRMLGAATLIYDALKRLQPCQRITVDREPGGRIRSSDYDLQTALREIEETDIEPEEGL